MQHHGALGWTSKQDRNGNNIHTILVFEVYRKGWAVGTLRDVHGDAIKDKKAALDPSRHRATGKHLLKATCVRFIYSTQKRKS